MDHVEGDTMPSESEFVATLDNRRKGGKVPRLEATDEELRAFGGKLPPPVVSAQPAPAAAPASTSYPPLEAPAR
jgi:outer membrane protein assembly factor BamE